MFIVNASPNNDHSVRNDSTAKIVHDCLEIMQLCDLDIITTSYSNERKLLESEEFTHFDTLLGVVNLKYLDKRDVQTEKPFTPVYSMVNNDAATTEMVNIFCKLLNRSSYGNSGYVSARNAWFEQYAVPRAVCVNLASCNLDSEFQREVPAYGERLACCLIAYMEYLLPVGKHLIDSKCKEFFGERSNYLNNKYPFEL